MFSYDPMTLLSPPLGGVAPRQLLERRTNLLILMQRPWAVSIFSRAPLCLNTCRHCLMITNASLPTALSCGTSAVTTPKVVPFLRPVGLLSMTNLNGGHAGFTILATCLARASLQIFTAGVLILPHSLCPPMHISHRWPCTTLTSIAPLAAGSLLSGFCAPYFTARSVSLDNESSKLLLLTPHNDAVCDLQNALGLPASNYLPSSGAAGVAKPSGWVRELHKGSCVRVCRKWVIV